MLGCFEDSALQDRLGRVLWGTVSTGATERGSYFLDVLHSHSQWKELRFFLVLHLKLQVLQNMALF